MRFRRADDGFGDWLCAFRGETETGEDFGEIIDEADAEIDIRGHSAEEVGSALVLVRRSDLLTLLAMAVELFKEAREPTSARPVAKSKRLSLDAPSSNGVYFVQQGNDGPIKIGKARDILARIRGLQTSNPFPLRLCGWIPGAGLKEEKRLHARFERYRLLGEWFAPVPALLEFILTKAASPSWPW